MGNLWGLFCEAGEQVRRHFVLTDGERIAIAVASRPSGVMARGDAHVRVSELATHISEMDSCGEELRSEGVPQILR